MSLLGAPGCWTIMVVSIFNQFLCSTDRNRMLQSLFSLLGENYCSTKKGMCEFLLILEGHIHLVHPVVVTFPLVFPAPALKCCGKNYALVLLLARWIELRVLGSAWQPPLSSWPRFLRDSKALTQMQNIQDHGWGDGVGGFYCPSS